MDETEMVIDSIRMPLIGNRKVVILKEKDGERYLPIYIGSAEAATIAVKLQGVVAPRPLTHGSIYSIIGDLGAILKHVVIDKLTGGTFHAKAFLEREGKLIKIDCRLSDALAAAIGANAPIFVTEEILKKAGIAIDELGEINERKEEA